MADAALRQLTLLRNIPREPQLITTKALHSRLVDAGYSVALRTIQRDMEKLSAHFSLVQNKPHGPGKEGIGWSFTLNDKGLSFPVMGSAAALSLSMAFQYLSQLIPSQALDNLEPLKKEAEETLNQYNSIKYRKWVDKVRTAPQHLLLPPQIAPHVINRVYQALLEGKKFKATYKGKQDQILNPYGLIQQGHTLYLICKFFSYENVRITALHRYSDVEILDERVTPYPEFNIDDYLYEGVMHWLLDENPKIKLKLRVDKKLAIILEETPVTYDQIIESDDDPDWKILVTDTNDSYQLRRWLLSQAEEVEVLEPVELRQWLKSSLQKTLDAYR